MGSQERRDWETWTAERMAEEGICVEAIVTSACIRYMREMRSLEKELGRSH